MRRSRTSALCSPATNENLRRWRVTMWRRRRTRASRPRQDGRRVEHIGLRAVGVGAYADLVRGGERRTGEGEQRCQRREQHDASEQISTQRAQEASILSYDPREPLKRLCAT